MYNKALEIQIKCTGEAHWLTLVNKGICLCRLRRYSDALHVLHQAHDAVLRQLGPAHVNCHKVMIWMGNAERELGRPADALPKHQAALAATRAAFGNEHYNAMSRMRCWAWP